MAQVLCSLVVFLVGVVCADESAVVQQVEDFDSVSPVLEYQTVQSGVYPHQEESGLEWLTRVTAQRSRAVDGMTEQCSEDMEIYWNALKNGELWASQVYDANGRYTSQLLFGNQFWLGSKSLCSEVPPTNFNVTFRVARIDVSLPKILGPKTTKIVMGVCHPESCTINDTRLLLTSAVTISSNNDSMTVLDVRHVPGDYSILNDLRFQLISIIAVVVSSLVILGSLYEGLQGSEENDASDLEKKAHNNNAYEEDKACKGKSEEAQDVSMKSKGESEEGSQNNLIRRNRRGIASQIILSFSAISNGKRIIGSSSNSEDSLSFVHGLRFFSLTWVILVHTYLQLFAVGSNRMIRVLTERSFMYQTIGNATYSVDSFFFISGLLIAYLYNRQLRKDADSRKETAVLQIVKFFKLTTYRILRLTPTYFIVLGMVQISMTFLRSNSVFDPNVADDANCKNYWWRNILYINNLFPQNEMCMIWSWYMAADTQFFVLGTIVLIAAKRKFKIVACTLGVILVAAWCTTMFISYTNQYMARIEAPFDLFDELYDKPWTRIGPYVVGMATGWYISLENKRTSLPWVAVLFGWIFCAAGMLSLVYGLKAGLGVAVSAVYAAFGHTVWGICLAWIAIACYMGYGGAVNWLLSTKLHHPLSRLTYCAYLTHPFIMYLTSFVMDGSFHIHNGLIVIIFLGNTVASFLLAFLLSLLFEAPVVRLLKIFIR